MLSNNKTVKKMLEICQETVIADGKMYMVIPHEMFTLEEIEELRKDDAAEVRFYKRHVYANFLPDDVRPSNVKKL